MKLLEFIDKLNTSSNEKIRSLTDCAINEITEYDDNNQIVQKIKSIKENEFTDFGDKITTCIQICDLKTKEMEGLGEDPYFQKIKSFKEILNKISSIIQAEGKLRSSKKSRKDSDYAIVQNLDVMHEQIQKLNLVQESANAAINSAENTRKELDSKTFQLLINTVAILGIFVAIAFTGLGSISIFSSIDLEIALQSNKAFITNIFFVFLTGTLVYNLLIVLVYFIFKLSRPLNSIKANNDESTCTFRNDVKLLPFIIADAALAILTVASFVATFFVC